MKIVFMLLISFSVFAQDNSSSKESDKKIIDFERIKNVLKNDLLDKEAEKKTKILKKQKIKKLQSNKEKYDFPSEDDIWGFLSEMWLVKNAPILKWDFEKVDFGLEHSFSKFLETMGIYEKKFKILIVNTPTITHMGIPGSNGEYIFLLSLPFMRKLDLSKLEISLIMFEDYLRVENQYLQKFILTKELKQMLGKNFHNKKFDKKVIFDVVKKYDNFILDKGFSFKQQFEVTKSMSRYLKDDLKLWNSYYQMIVKIDDLIKTNVLYKEYLKIYPSPEIQMNWLRPKTKKL